MIWTGFSPYIIYLYVCMCICGSLVSKTPQNSVCRVLSPSGIFASVLDRLRYVLARLQKLNKSWFQFFFVIKGLNSANLCLGLLELSSICRLSDFKIAKFKWYELDLVHILYICTSACAYGAHLCLEPLRTVFAEYCHRVEFSPQCSIAYVTFSPVSKNWTNADFRFFL